jgi:hypothetical protein
MVVLSINTALKAFNAESTKIYTSSPPPKSDVNLKTGQIVDDTILPWSLYSTLLLYGAVFGLEDAAINSLVPGNFRACYEYM